MIRYTESQTGWENIAVQLTYHSTIKKYFRVLCFIFYFNNCNYRNTSTAAIVLLTILRQQYGKNGFATKEKCQYNGSSVWIEREKQSFFPKTIIRYTLRV